MAAPLVLWESLNTLKTLLRRLSIAPMMSSLLSDHDCLSRQDEASVPGVFFFPPDSLWSLGWLSLEHNDGHSEHHITANNGSASLHTCKPPHTALTLCLTQSVDSVSNYMSLQDNCFWGLHWPQALCFLHSTWKLWCLKPLNGRKKYFTKKVFYTLVFLKDTDQKWPLHIKTLDSALHFMHGWYCVM